MRKHPEKGAFFAAGVDFYLEYVFSFLLPLTLVFLFMPWG
jgi:hypothetical protein